MVEDQKRNPFPWLLHKQEAWEEPLAILRRREMRRVSNWIFPTILVVGATIAIHAATVLSPPPYFQTVMAVSGVLLFDYVLFFGSVLATYRPVKCWMCDSRIVSELLATPMARDRLLLIPQATLLDIWRYLLIAHVAFTVVISTLSPIAEGFSTNLAFWSCVTIAKAYLAYPSVSLAISINQRYLVEGSAHLHKIVASAIFHAISISLVSIIVVSFAGTMVWGLCLDLMAPGRWPGPAPDTLFEIVGLCFFTAAILFVSKMKEWCARGQFKHAAAAFREAEQCRRSGPSIR